MGPWQDEHLRVDFIKVEVVVSPDIGRHRADTQPDDAETPLALGQSDHGEPDTAIGGEIGCRPGCADGVGELQAMQRLAVVLRQMMPIGAVL